MIVDKVKIVMSETDDPKVHEKEVNEALSEINELTTSEVLDINLSLSRKPCRLFVTHIWYSISDEV